MGTAKTVRSL